jgi:hypothetical protein
MPAGHTPRTGFQKEQRKLDLFDNLPVLSTSLWNLPQNGGKFRRFCIQTIP